ncbi:MAG TPA: hypothetical protein VFV72_03280 [Candidatus Limnocylindrales bacterium]|nr:hypothetical protein [Candidatus Limnocylindrales bacterium]
MRAALLVPIAILVSACLLPAKQFSLTLDGKGVVDDLPVIVEDRSGQVVAVAPALPGQFNLQEGIAAGDAPSDIVVTWLGGQCDHHAHLAVDAANGIYTITETTESARSCSLAGFLRTVTIRFSVPVRPGSVTLEHQAIAR